MKFFLSLSFSIITFFGFSQEVNMNKVMTEQQKDGSILYETTFSFEGDTALLRKTIRNVMAYPEFTEAVESVTVIEKNSEYVSYYMLYDLPWPLDGRQSVSKSMITYEGPTMVLFTQPGEVEIEGEEDAIWMTNFLEKWIIRQTNEGIVTVEVTGKMDLEGSIPGWLVESFIPTELKRSYEEIALRSKN